MATGEARYDRFSIFGDVIYTKLGADGDTPNGILADNVDVTSKTFSGFLGGGYAVLRRPKWTPRYRWRHEGLVGQDRDLV